MSESEQQEPTIIEPMEATTALVDGLATCPSIDGLLTGGHAADLVMPGEYVIPSQAEPALEQGKERKLGMAHCSPSDWVICMSPITVRESYLPYM